MSITGATIINYAVDETLGTQSEQSGNNTVVVTDDIQNITGNNGNVLGTDYIGRVIVINLGGTEQTRYVTGDTAGTGDLRILTVSEDWDTNPVSTDTIHVFYNMEDVDNVNSDYNTRTGFYEMSEQIVVGEGTNAAGLVMMEGDLVEIEDSKSSTVYSLEIKKLGRLQIGYKQAGLPVAGAYLTGINNSQGESWTNFEPGSEGRLYDARFIAGLNPLQINVEAEGAETNDIYAENFSIFQGTDEGIFFDSNWKDGSITGSSTTSEIIRVNSGTNFENVAIINTDGLTTASSDTSTETIELNEITFIGNNDYITLESNKTWNMIDPVWDASTYTDFTWTTSTLNYVYDKRSVAVVAQTPSGTKIANANVLIYEGSQLDDLVLETYTDANGIASGAFTYKLHSTNSSTTTYGSHALRVDCWLYTPFISAQTSTEAFAGTVTLLSDSNIVQTTQATALSDGSGITWNDETNPSSVIEFTATSGTLSVGDTITASPSGATGIVTILLDGNSTDGTAHLKTRNSTAFANSDTLASDGAGSWTGGAYVSDSEQEYSIWIDGNSLSFQVIHDYFAALTSSLTLTTNGELAHEWGADSQGRVLYKSGDDFYTSRSNSKGIIIIDTGAGNVSGFEDDAGVDWTPPSQVTLTITTIDPTNDPVGDVRCSIFKTSDDSELMNADSNTSTGIATAGTETPGSPYDIYWRVRESPAAGPRYKPKSGLGEVTTNGFSVTVTMELETVVEETAPESSTEMEDTLEMLDATEMV